MIMTSKRMDLEFIAPPQTRARSGSHEQEIPMAEMPESELRSMRNVSSPASLRSFYMQPRMLPSVSHILQPLPSTLQPPIRPRLSQGQLAPEFPLPPHRDEYYHQEQQQWPRPQAQTQSQALERRDSSIEGHYSSSAYLSASSSTASQKHKRRRATSLQLGALNGVFERTMFPTTEERNGLARELGMSSRTVQIWFQNKRQAFRANERKHSVDSASGDHVSSSLTPSEVDDSVEDRATVPDSPISVDQPVERSGA